MRHHLAMCVAAMVLAFGSVAAAQGMVFRLGETGGEAPPPPADWPPSEAMINALHLYQQGAYQEAAVLFERVIERGAIEDPASAPKKAIDRSTGDNATEATPSEPGGVERIDQGPKRLLRSQRARLRRHGAADMGETGH
jgi:hypothetical protein